MADGAEEGKIFVGGLSWETTEEKLRNYFADFGEVSECMVMKNSDTGKSRGFGFVTFTDPNTVKKVLLVSNHQLDGRTIDPKECNPKTAAKSRRDQKNTNMSKIFLGGLPPNITETNLRDFFSKYGKVTEAIIMFNQEKKKSRGFGFLSFDSEDAINKVVAEHFVNIHGKQVEVKRAEPQPHKSNTPVPNGGVPLPHHPAANVGVPYLVAPFPLWPPGAVIPPAGYPPNLWNPAAAAAVALATAAATNSPPLGGWVPPNPYGYPTTPGWPPSPANPYGHQPPPGFGQPIPGPGTSNANSHGSGGGPVQPPTPNFLPTPPNNVGSINQSMPNNSNASMTGGPLIPPGPGNSNMGNFQHEANNFGLSRSNPNFVNGGSPAGGFGAHNAHHINVGSQIPNWNHAMPGSFGGNAPGVNSNSGNGIAGPTGQMQPPGTAMSTGNGTQNIHHANDPMSSSYNSSLQFHGSRLVSQNLGYHPYRRS